MNYLHSEIGSHGYLKSSNVLVTGCFTVKISDFGTLSRYSCRVILLVYLNLIRKSAVTISRSAG